MMTTDRPQPPSSTATEATQIRVRGIVQGVGFRPFVFRLATSLNLAGWVLNGGEGVRIHVQGERESVARFLTALRSPPPAAVVESIDTEVRPAEPTSRFVIRESPAPDRPTARISPDLPVCDACLRELFDPDDRRFGYPYINCSHCGPRYTILLSLPYDRAATTMKDWPMCEACLGEYGNPADRRFHAQPLACPDCGPHYCLQRADQRIEGDAAAIRAAADELNAGRIVAVKGLGGFHLACDALDPHAVERLRRRKSRRDKPFALMAASLDVAREVADLDSARQAIESSARPIVTVAARRLLPGVAPDNRDLGLMLPYTPLHHLLYAEGAPQLLVMTSANRSSEPIAFRDDEAYERLADVADAFLVGERPIARRVDDSVVAPDDDGLLILRRARGMAPGVVARLPAREPILAVGADLKNTVTLVIDGEAMTSHHVGDLSHYDCFSAFRETIEELLAIYRIDAGDLTVAHDLHPQFASTAHALALGGRRTLGMQHHRAHVAGVMAERDALSKRVLGIVLDGTGWGDDGTIWGGEVMVGSVAQGFDRVGHLHPASLPGGDAAARFPVQAAAGFLAQLEDLPDLTAPPFDFPDRYADARRLVDSGVRVFQTTSAGRLFDTAASLLGFTGPATFEGQAPIWLEHLARGAGEGPPLPLPWREPELDYRPTLAAMIAARQTGESPARLAAAFHRAVASGLAAAALDLAHRHDVRTIALSGGVLQNRLLRRELTRQLQRHRLEVWCHRGVPPNDGGVSLGQAALAATAEPTRA